MASAWAAAGENKQITRAAADTVKRLPGNIRSPPVSKDALTPSGGKAACVWLK
jgi:hypothetical protein